MRKPMLDAEFTPAITEIRKFRDEVAKYENRQHLVIAVERAEGYVYRKEFDILPEGVDDKRNSYIVERMIKTILWVVGGYKIYIAGSHRVFRDIRSCYQPGGERNFDYDFMSTVYESEVKVLERTYETIPEAKECSQKVGGHLDGKRIGFDAGGSDRKCSAVLNGETIYSEEVVWAPKKSEDINYQLDGIRAAYQTAIDKLGGDVDAIGVSTAGVIVNSRPMVSSIFLKIPKKDFEKVKYSYIGVAREFEQKLGHPIPTYVANDGDVTALAGAIDLKDTGVLGIAMGTSEAVGYVDPDGNLNGWISELAFAPLDFAPNAMRDEWSGDIGVGCKYLSQDAVIKLCPKAGITLDDSLSLGEKLKVVQKMHEEGHEGAKKIFESIGVYLAYAVAYYCEFYQIKHVLILGRVTSGKGGDVILKTAAETLKEDFPEYSGISFDMPSEYMRRVGQSIAAASLPESAK